MRQHINRTNRTDITEFMKRYNIEHTVTLTSQSKVIEETETGRKIIISDNEFSKKDMFFLFSVHNHAKKIKIDNYHVEGGIRYNAFNANIQNGFSDENFCEIDVSSAYWELAKSCKIINEKTYNKGLKVSKVVRLAALGSLATSKVIYKWNIEGGRYEKIGHKRNETYPLFFYVAKRFGEWISGICNEAREVFGFDSVAGYWVDAIFCKDGDVAEFVKNKIVCGGYAFKYFPCEASIREDESGLVTLFIKHKETGRIKPFLIESRCKDEVREMIINGVGDEIKHIRKFFN